MTGPRAKVLDAWAVVAWLRDEGPASHAVEALWIEGRTGSTRLLLNIVNLGEIYYITAKAGGIERAEMVLAELRNLPVEVLPASNPLVLEAARLKGRHRVSYADAFAAVTAHREKASLVTGDPELKRLSETGFMQVDWVGR